MQDITKNFYHKVYCCMLALYIKDLPLQEANPLCWKPPGKPSSHWKNRQINHLLEGLLKLTPIVEMKCTFFIPARRGIFFVLCCVGRSFVLSYRERIFNICSMCHVQLQQGCLETLHRMPCLQDEVKCIHKSVLIII